MTTVAPLLQANNYYDFRCDSTISADLVAQLRQQAKATGTYYANASARRRRRERRLVPAGGGRRQGHLHRAGRRRHRALHPERDEHARRAVARRRLWRRARMRQLELLDVLWRRHRRNVHGRRSMRCTARRRCRTAGPTSRSRRGSQVVGGAFVDDNASLSAANRHGFVNVVPPPLSLATAINTLPICQNFLTKLVCSLASTLTGTLDHLLSVLGISAGTLAAALVPQLNTNLPAITFNAAAVNAVKAMGDSALVPGTFRRVQPKF